MEYLSPEQATAAPDLDVRCDLYSLGASFYQLLTGWPPFVGATARAVVQLSPVSITTRSPRLRRAETAWRLSAKPSTKRPKILIPSRWSKIWPTL